MQALGAEIQQVAQGDRGHAAHCFGVAAIQLKTLGGHRFLEHVDQAAVEGVGFAALAEFVDAADRERGHVGVP